eukprot:COSAG03_NODE_3619_length_1919_cov_1.163187_2_plen_97_part_00
MSGKGESASEAHLCAQLWQLHALSSAPSPGPASLFLRRILLLSQPALIHDKQRAHSWGIVAAARSRTANDELDQRSLRLRSEIGTQKTVMSPTVDR